MYQRPNFVVVSKGDFEIDKICIGGYDHCGRGYTK